MIKKNFFISAFQYRNEYKVKFGIYSYVCT